MTINIKCDQLPDGWDYDACLMCRHFSAAKTQKGRQWRCKLNSATTHERREFRMIWADEFLRAHGMALDEDDIVIEYTGKKKRRREGEGDSK